MRRIEYGVEFAVSNLVNGTVRITGFAALPPDNRVFIPETIGNRKVTELADGLFKDKANLEVVVLPEGLRRIGSGAFSGCTGLKRLEFQSEPPQVDGNLSLDPSKVTIYVPADMLEWQGVSIWQDCPVIAR